MFNDNQATNLVDFGQDHLNNNPEDDCQCGGPRCREFALSDELDNILEPRLIFDSPRQLDLIWPLLHRRHMDTESFLSYLAEFQATRQCGYAWTAGQVAYRCRTCSRFPSMSLCFDCFRAGDHTGHDYNMFKSVCGGVCDCGHKVVTEKGHCSRHGENATSKRSNEQVPESIICAPRRSFPRLIHRLAIALRRSHVDINGEVDIYLNCLNQIASSSSILRGLMIDALLSEKVYSSQIQLLSNHPHAEVSKTVNEGLKKLKREQKGLTSIRLPESWNSRPVHNINAFCDHFRTINSFLDELLFWAVLFEFPTKLNNFLLGFLIEERYKYVFAQKFVLYYPRLVVMLASVKGEPRRNPRDSYQQLSRRITQISAQLFHDTTLTRILCDKEHVLHTIIYCIRIAIEGSPTHGLKGALLSNPITLFSSNPQITPLIVSHDNLIIRDGHLGSFIQNLGAILVLEHEAKRLVADKSLLNTWIEMLSYFQTMSPYRRALDGHDPYETGPQISLFAVEADFCLSPLWSILNHLKDESTLSLTKNLLYTIQENLMIWFREMSICPNSRLDKYHVSFHIPLHRMFAATLRHMLFIQDRSDQEVYDCLATNQTMLAKKYANTFFRRNSDTPVETPSTKSFIKILLLHPLQALTICHETRSSMWIRNGFSTAHHALTYIHCSYCYSTIDLDMFLLRYCASKLEPDYYLRILMTRFHAWKWLSFKSNSLMSNSSNDLRAAYHNILPEQILAMVENALAVIIQLLTLSIHCDISERNQTRQEMIALISVRDRHYSYIIDMLRDRSISTQADPDDELRSILNEVAYYKAPQHGGNLQQGSYTLKPEVWDEEYDPIQVLYRFNMKKDYQMSLDRYFQHCKMTGKLENKYHRSTLWPPMKIPKNIGHFGKLDINGISQCTTLVGLIFSILYKTLYISEVPDPIMAYAIQLLELSVRKCRETFNGTQCNNTRFNTSFDGEYAYEELTSYHAYFGAKSQESFIKGGTIYSLSNKQHDNKNKANVANYQLFPVVRHALDLAFDTFWFPFNAILDNAIVHIENVHLMSSQDFEDFLRCPADEEDSNDDDDVGQVKGRVDANDDQGDDEDGGEVGRPWFFSEDSSDDDIDDDDDEDDDEDDDDDVEIDDDDDMVSVSHNSTASESTLDTDKPASANQPLEVGDRNTASDNLDALAPSTLRLSGGSSTLTAVSPSPSSVASPMTTRPATASDHTYSAVVDSVMEVESLPESQSTALSLLPVHDRPTVSGHEVISTTVAPPTFQQIYPENLVTERRAILASDPQPMLTNTTQPLALEAPPSSHGLDPNKLDHSTPTTSSSEGVARGTQRSLSEVDILARFKPFFQTRPESGVGSGGGGSKAQLCRTRPMARRGGLRQGAGGTRGHPVAPYAIHNPNSVQPTLSPPVRPLYLRNPISDETLRNLSNTIQVQAANLISLRDSHNINNNMAAGGAAATGNHHHHHHHHFPIDTERFESDSFEPRRVQTARRSGACTLLNRVLHTRSLQHHNQQQQTNQDRPRSSHQQQQRQSQFRMRRARRDQAHHGESLLSLLLRLHAKYSQRARSYEFNEARAKMNVSINRSRIGDGVHFVTVVLDLICSMDVSFKLRVEHLKDLIWGDKQQQQQLDHERQEVAAEMMKATDAEADAATGQDAANRSLQSDSMDLSGELSKTGSPLMGCRAGDSGSPGLLTGDLGATPPPPPTSDKRQRARELQTRLMADFAKKQKAFIENYESLSQQQPAAHSGATTSSISRIAQLADQCKSLDSFTSGPGAASTAGATCLASATIAQQLADEEPINLSSKSTTETAAAAAATTTSQPSNLDKQQQQRLTSDDKSEKGSGTQPGSGLEGQAGPSASAGQAYECCICGVEGPSDLANPLGQVVLLQSTSVYGHSHLRPQWARRLPCDERQYMELREETYAKYLERRIDLLCEHFPESSWLDSINIGAEGGVHVQSCGHYLHIECHQSYIKSLDQERHRFRSDSDEFLCPVCRQLANSVLPILNLDCGRPAADPLQSGCGGDGTGQNSRQQIELIARLLERRLPPDRRELQSSATFCAHLTKATGPQYRLVRSTASMHSLFLFLTSIARTNLETEVIVRSIQSRWSAGVAQASGGDSKRSCFMLLFHVLALNAQTLINNQWFTCGEMWRQLTHRDPNDHQDHHQLHHQSHQPNRLSLRPTRSKAGCDSVPLLLRDPTSMLLQFSFAIAASLAPQPNFTCLVRVLFNLVVIQSIALVLSYAKPSLPTKSHQAETMAASSFDDLAASSGGFERLAKLVVRHLDQLLAPSNEQPLLNSSVRQCWKRFSHLNPTASSCDEDQELGDERLDEEKPIWFIENRVKLACLPYLRAAAFMQHQLYNQPYPQQLQLVDDHQLAQSSAIDADFATLASYLNLVASEDEQQTESTSVGIVQSLQWPESDALGSSGGEQLIASWSNQLLRFATHYSIAARSLLLCRSLAWFRPSLMQLPHFFDDIFMFYYRKECSLCQQVPRDVAICLVCGAPICFRVSCCKDRSRSRVVHSQHCGANTAVFLAVHTSSIVVIRGNRACVWGSVYLDAHGEEDNGLQRGKPLYLVPARFQLLERQWLTHTFDHKYSKPWIFLPENQ